MQIVLDPDPFCTYSMDMNNAAALTDAELTTMMLALLATDSCRRTTEQLLHVTAGRADRAQMIKVLFAANDAGKISYRRDSGWRIV